MATLGARLKMERESRGVSIKEIADATNINMSFLEGLENDDYSEFPAEVFIIGFLRSYSNHLGIDSEKVILDYESTKAEKSSETADTERIETDGNNITIIVLVVILFLFATAYVVYQSTINSGINRVGARSSQKATPKALKKVLEPAKAKTAEVAKTVPLPDEGAMPSADMEQPPLANLETEQKPLPDKVKAEPAVEKPKTGLVPEKPVEKPKPVLEIFNKKDKIKRAEEALKFPTGKYRLELIAGKEDVWVLVLVDDERVRNMFVRSGQRIVIRGNKSYLFTTGNAKHIKLILNGEEVKMDVPASGVIRNWKIPLPQAD